MKAIFKSDLLFLVVCVIIALSGAGSLHLFNKYVFNTTVYSYTEPLEPWLDLTKEQE